ncbi:MAG: hypothetical protein LBG99_05905 [Propionibacteriaceae bacterium]|nr:hypothetical protein [Propionibacteriaceae bacterium]
MIEFLVNRAREDSGLKDRESGVLALLTSAMGMDSVVVVSAPEVPAAGDFFKAATAIFQG